MRIVEDDLSGADIAELLAFHLAEAHANSPPGNVFALDLTGLRVPAITFWTAREGKDLLGCVALKELGDGTGEIKSMRTAPAHLRRGVARALLDHLLAQAKRRGLHRLWLETGGSEAFAAARALYAKAGFASCGAFGDYAETRFNRFMTRAL